MTQRLAYCGIFVLAVLAGWLGTSQWGNVEASVRAVICAIGAVLIVLAQVLGARPGASILRFVSIAALVAWCGSSLGWTVARPLSELPSGDSVQGWSNFHYYLGPKYFRELGYRELYEQALAADADGARNWRKIDRVRSLQTYQIEDVQSPDRSDRWSDDRWQAFQADLEALEPYVRKRDWRRLFLDRGYNASPTWTTIRRAVNGFEVTPRNLALIGCLDVLVLLVAFVAVGRVFGPLRAVVCFTWLALYFGNAGDRLVGQLFLYDYVAALLLAACALKTDRPFVAGALLAYATMMRVFPVLLLAGLAWWGAQQWRRTRSVSDLPVRVALGFLATSLVLGAIGFANGRGREGWEEFAANLRHHSEQHVVGSRRIGLGHLFTVDWSDPPVGEQRVNDRLEVWRAQKGNWQVLAAAIGVLWCWATARRRLDLCDTTLAALVLVFCGVALSRYYWSVACLLMLIGGGARDGPLGGRGPTAIATALFAWSSVVYAYISWYELNLDRYLFANFVATGLLVGALGVMIYGARRIPLR